MFERPPRHLHDDADQALYVAEGAFEVLSDGETARVNAGKAAFAPQANTAEGS